VTGSHGAWRRYRRVAALLGALIVVSGCTITTPSPTATPASSMAATPSLSPTSPGESLATGTAAPGAPASGDLRLAVDGDPSSFTGTGGDEPARWVSNLLHAPLYRLNARYEAVPWLAAALPEVSADGLIWTIRLRDGLRFHDGSAVSADDVAFSYELVLSRDCTHDPLVCQALQDTVESVAASDDLTFVVRLRQRFAPLLETGLTAVPVLPRAAVEASVARFEATAGLVKPDEASALVDRITTAISDEACWPPEHPAACDPASHVGEIEPILTRAGVALPDRRAYVFADGSPDVAGYAEAILGRLGNLAAALRDTGVDRAAAALDLIDFGRQPIGAGPYRFERYEPGSQVVLSRSPYWLRVPVAPARAVVRIIRDPSAAVTALRQGEVEWVASVGDEAVSDLASGQGTGASTFPGADYYSIAFNMREGRLYADLRLRRAFATCIDVAATVAEATGGTGIAMNTNKPPGSWMADTGVVPYARNVAAARALIERSGWTPGSDGIYAKGDLRLSTDLWVREGRPERIAFAESAKRQLADCGIEIRVKQASFETLLPLLFFPNAFDTYLGGSRVSMDFDDFGMFHSSQCPTREAPGGGNVGCWRSQEADRLVEAERSGRTLAERTQTYRSLQTLVRKEVPYLFLWYDPDHRGYSKRISVQAPGTFDLSGPYDWWNQDAWFVPPG
jgi:ABC-type transport system substrate-binding protein